MALLDGVERLTSLLVGQARYPSVVAAVAEHAVFLHPETVAQTRGEPLFPVIRLRNMSERGNIATHAGRRVLLDDNTAPTSAFLWAAGLKRGGYRDTQFNHVWNASRDVGAYTALWNVCATPAFLAKTTDGSNHPQVIAALRYHAYKQFGMLPADTTPPPEPTGYAELRWAESTPRIADLEASVRERLRRSPKSRTAKACREIGWLFSGWDPDPSI